MTNSHDPVALEILKMARELVINEYTDKRAQDHNKWLADFEVIWKNNRVRLPYPDIPPYPTEIEIVARAQILMNFLHGNYLVNVGERRVEPAPVEPAPVEPTTVEPTNVVPLTAVTPAEHNAIVPLTTGLYVHDTLSFEQKIVREDVVQQEELPVSVDTTEIVKVIEIPKETIPEVPVIEQPKPTEISEFGSGRILPAVLKRIESLRGNRS